MEYDVFISYASEDRVFVSELVAGLKNSGLSVWYDQDMLKNREGHGSNIEMGIISSRYAIAVISKTYLKKRWPEAEFGAIRILEMNENKNRIIVVFHGAPRNEFGIPFGRDPVKNTVSSENGLIFVIAECVRLISEMKKEAAGINSSEKAPQNKSELLFPLGRYAYYGDVCPNCGAPITVGNHSIWCTKCDYIDEMEPV